MFTHLFRILKYGTSYAIATGFFPKETAKNVLLLYSFVRIPDNIVDNVTKSTKKQQKVSNSNKILGTHYIQAKIKLERLRDSRTQTYTNNERSDPTRGQYIALFQDNDIPFQYSLDFYKAMIDDCTIHRYKTYEQLEGYMYGSASVVGLMMCHLIGFVDTSEEKIAKSYATELGNAMQLTNFLRDVREDYEDLGRIYMPGAELAHYGLSHADIISFCHGGYTHASAQQKKARSDYMSAMIIKCRTLYDHSLDGLQYLQPDGRKAVRFAAVLYASILDKIERNHYDVFTKSARTTLFGKCKTLSTIL